MDSSRSLLLNIMHLYQEKSMDEETTWQNRRDETISQLQEMLLRAIKERDEAQRNCKKLTFDTFLLQQKLSALECSVISSIDHPIKAMDSLSSFSDSDDQSIVSSSPPQHDFFPTVKKPLPENGKFLEAVVKAGPLLQTILVAGDLPRWLRPPPSVDHREIPTPPVKTPPTHITNCSGKRSFLPEQGCADYSCPELKYRKVVPQ